MSQKWYNFSINMRHTYLWDFGECIICHPSNNYQLSLDLKYKINCNNMIINAHIHICSNRAYQLRIEMALIPLMGS
jgi:hypothetical protein